MSFDLLSEPVRRFVRDQKWEALRPIQHAAISKILTTDTDYILASRTASGKTEAAFLPILSSVERAHSGVQVLYISPLKALINDQFYRVEELCKYLDFTVTKWHGDANRTDKERLIKYPNGILLITPESLEAMLANKPFVARHLFSELKFTIIDEIHSFIGTDRGTHLKSLIYRLQEINSDRFRLIGLSATIGDYAEAKRFTGNIDTATVLLDRTSRDIETQFRYFEQTDNDLPIDLLKDLYKLTRDKKVLVFPNSRGRTEEIAVKLKKIAEKTGGHSNYFSHHSSIDKDVREYVEFFAKSARRENFAIACTSTLELGIDIGSVDAVAQIDATSGVSSLIQRIGRSGRKEGATGSLSLYSTNEWSLLQSLACWTLSVEGIIEPPDVVARPYDILLHQILSVVKGHSGIDRASLVKQMNSNFAFEGIDRSDIEYLIEHLIVNGILETIRSEIIIGVDGEQMVNSRDFYSVFESDRVLGVMAAGRRIGELPYSTQLVVGEKIYFAARIWKIADIDFHRHIVEVIPTPQGKIPKFSGGEQNVHPIIRERMLSLLYSAAEYPVLDGASIQALENLRKEFSIYKVDDLDSDRPLLQKDGKAILFTFTGSKVAAALMLLFRMAGLSNRLHTSCGIELDQDFKDLDLSDFIRDDNAIDEQVSSDLRKNATLAKFSKWSMYLPEPFQVSLLKEKRYDFNGAIQFLKKCRPISP